jgi:hypothetical protein
LRRLDIVDDGTRVVFGTDPRRTRIGTILLSLMPPIKTCFLRTKQEKTTTLCRTVTI